MVIVVRVRDVPERDGDACFLHLRDVPERYVRRHPIEAREAGVTERVCDRRAGRVFDNRVTAGDRGVDVEGAKEALEAGVATRLVGQEVVFRVRALIADPTVDSAVDCDADKVGQRLRPLRAGKRSDL